MDFSLIVPCFNEEENLRVFIPTAISYFEALDAMCELVFVDDGSSDATYQVIQDQIEAYEKRTESAQKEDGRRLAFQVVGFSRNFGKEAAMYAGLERATGDVLGFIDADMQQDPAVAVRMFRLLRDDPSYDCVAAVQEQRRESLPHVSRYERSRRRRGGERLPRVHAAGRRSASFDARAFPLFKGHVLVGGLQHACDHLPSP